LACFKARLCLVDDVKPASATNNLIVAMAFFQRFQGVLDFHVVSWLGKNTPEYRLLLVRDSAPGAGMGFIERSKPKFTPARDKLTPSPLMHCRTRYMLVLVDLVNLCRAQIEPRTTIGSFSDIHMAVERPLGGNKAGTWRQAKFTNQ
jgi:hypothetical protein